MAVKIKTAYDTVEEIPEGFGELYAERNGKFELIGVDGIKTQSDIDNIINTNLVGGRQAGAQGLQSVGGTELAAGTSSINQALSALGISGNAGENVATDAAGTYADSAARAAAAGQASAGAINAILDFAFA